MPKTLRLRADRADDMAQAAGILRSGGLVAFPTETVYGLGANALEREAVAGIFLAKGRPAWDPLIVHIADFNQVRDIAEISRDLQLRVHSLAQRFWPGPLTLLLPRTGAVPDAVTAGRPKVAVRLPSHPVARALLQAVGMPIAAPSANRFGHVSPTTAQHVLDDLDGRIDAVLDGGATSLGVESTVLDPTETPMILYRAGAVTLEMLRDTGILVQPFTPLEQINPQSNPLPSPGVGLRHYAPEAKLLLAGPSSALLAIEVKQALLRDAAPVGVLLPAEWQLTEPSVIVQPWGRWSVADTLAAGLFAGLRALEARGVAVIVCPLPEPGGLREALRDRLLKAARPRA